jgi:hypothetical protein
MSTKEHGHRTLSRRQWLVLAASSLSGCGGGSDIAAVPGTGGTGNLAGAPGTGGTGIFQGAISGFGSVIVNGITYGNAQAVMRINDVVVTQDQLRLGMVATVHGERVAGGVSGSASQIEVWSIAQGIVSGAAAGRFKVSGMTILTSAVTWVYGVNAGAVLTDGDYVSVWGLQADKDGQKWTASCIVVSNAMVDAVSSGLVRIDDGERKLNNVRLTGLAASGLADKTLARVQGTWSNDGSLNVVSVKQLDNAAGTQSQRDVEIEGVVTEILSVNRFMLGGIRVEALPGTFSPTGASVSVGSRVEVYGSWVGGVLTASKVKFEDTEKTRSVEIKAVLQQFTSLSDFVMQGQRCNASGVELGQKTIAALYRQGAVFKVKGIKNGDWLQVTEMSLA